MIPTITITDKVESEGNPQRNNWVQVSGDEYAGRIISSADILDLNGYTPLGKWEWDKEEWDARKWVKIDGFKLGKEDDKNEVWGNELANRKVGGRFYLNENVKITLSVSRSFKSPDGEISKFKWSIDYTNVHVDGKIPKCTRSEVRLFGDVVIPPEETDCEKEILESYKKGYDEGFANSEENIPVIEGVKFKGLFSYFIKLLTMYFNLIKNKKWYYVFPLLFISLFPISFVILLIMFMSLVF